MAGSPWLGQQVSARCFGESPVLTAYQKPELLNKPTTHRNEHLLVELNEAKGLLCDPPAAPKRGGEVGKTGGRGVGLV